MKNRTKNKMVQIKKDLQDNIRIAINSKSKQKKEQVQQNTTKKNAYIHENILKIIPLKAKDCHWNTEQKIKQAEKDFQEQQIKEQQKKYQKYILDETAQNQKSDTKIDHQAQYFISKSLKIDGDFLPLRNAVISEASHKKSYQRKLQKQRLKTSFQPSYRFNFGQSSKSHNTQTPQSKYQPHNKFRKLQQKLKSYKQFIQCTNSEQFNDIELFTYRNLMKIRKKMTLKNHLALNLSFDGKKQPIHTSCKFTKKFSQISNKQEHDFKSKQKKSEKKKNHKKNSYSYSIQGVNSFRQKTPIQIYDFNNNKQVYHKPQQNRSLNHKKMSELVTRRKLIQSNQQNLRIKSESCKNKFSNFTPWTKREQTDILNIEDTQQAILST